MPRVSARRAVLCLLPLVVVFLLVGLWSDRESSSYFPPQSNGGVLRNHQAEALIADLIPTLTTSEEEVTGAGRPWYMSGGKDGTSPTRGKLFPGESPNSDRIEVLSTMYVLSLKITDLASWKRHYVPTRIMFYKVVIREDQLLFSPETDRTRVILLYNGLGSWAPTKAGNGAFSTCPVKDCTLTASKSEASRADAILFKDHFSNPGITRPRRQVWILYMLECPYHTQHMKQNDVFNWTATYRRDSDLVAPYEKWVYFNKSVTALPITRNYAANKTKQVAWFVSNCGARNSRLQYAHELQKHISVDIFGACGSEKCPRSKQEKCFEMLDSDYKFYLAFENSNCKDYISEKFFVNGLGRDVIPIAMGARPEDYARSSPENSYIHVDDFDSPKTLAEYLHKLDKDDDLYNGYFRWKGTGEFINTHFFCRLCALLHDKYPTKSYRDINEWWRGPGVCTGSTWRKKNPNWYTSLTKRLASNFH